MTKSLTGTTLISIVSSLCKIAQRQLQDNSDSVLLFDLQLPYNCGQAPFRTPSSLVIQPSIVLADIRGCDVYGGGKLFQRYMNDRAKIGANAMAL
jgi:hypothetical protein